jgi:hypothetical protein
MNIYSVLNGLNKRPRLRKFIKFKASVAVRAIFVAEEPHSQIESWLPVAVPVVRPVTGLALVVA